jgi:O-antigen biosynthesis protein
VRHARKGLARALPGRREPDPSADGDEVPGQGRRDTRRESKSPEATLVRSGVFDLDYYSAASGEVFPDKRTAARHCVSSGMPAGLSPNPFLSPGFLPRRIQQAWQRGNVLKVLDYLANQRHWDEPIGPLFHPGRYAGQVSRSEELATATPLAHFVAQAQDDTPLPVPPGARVAVPSYGLARTALIDHARMVDAQERDLSGTDLAFHDPFSRPRQDHLPVHLHGTGVPVVTVVAQLAGSSAAARAAVLILQGQTLHRWELLLVGDTRDRDLPDLHDGRVRVVPLPFGADRDEPADWRNVGLAAAEGAYVAFLMPGHHWRPDFLRGAVQWLHDSGHSAGHAAVSLHDSTGRVTVMAGQGDLPTLRAGGFIDVGSLVCRTDAARAAGGFDPTLGAGAEPEFAIQLASGTPLDAFPFVASDRMVDRLPQQQTTAAGADGDWLAVIGKAWVSWADVRASLPSRVRGRASAVVPTFQDAAMTSDAVASLLRSATVDDLEVVVVDNGSTLDLGQQLTAAFLGDDRIRYRRLPVNLNFAIACNVGFALSTGEVVVFLNNDTRSDTDWLPGVVAHLDDPAVAGAQPVLLYPDGTIQTAGSIFPSADGLACHFLTGRPYADAGPTATMTFHAATAAALVMRAVDLAALEGFDPHYVNGMEDVDLCLRTLALRPGGFRVEPRSQLTHLEGKTPGRGKRIPQNRSFFMDRWRGRLPGPELDKFVQAGFEVVRIEDDGQPIPSPRPVITPRR